MMARAKFADELGKLDAVFGGDHLGRFLADHDGRRIRVTRDDRRHDTGVCHAQLADPEHPQPRVDDFADPAGRGRVVPQGLRMKISEVFDGMEFGVVRGVFLRSGGPHVGQDFGGRILGLLRAERTA